MGSVPRFVRQSPGGHADDPRRVLLRAHNAPAFHRNEIHPRRTEPGEQRNILADDDRPGYASAEKRGYHSDGCARICAADPDEVKAFFVARASSPWRAYSHA